MFIALFHMTLCTVFIQVLAIFYEQATNDKPWKILSKYRLWEVKTMNHHIFCCKRVTNSKKNKILQGKTVLLWWLQFKEKSRFCVLMKYTVIRYRHPVKHPIFFGDFFFYYFFGANHTFTVNWTGYFSFTVSLAY